MYWKLEDEGSHRTNKKHFRLCNIMEYIRIWHMEQSATRGGWRMTSFKHLIFYLYVILYKVSVCSEINMQHSVFWSYNNMMLFLVISYQIQHVDVLKDAGESLSPDIDVNQTEGAFTMGLGYWLLRASCAWSFWWEKVRLSNWVPPHCQNSYFWIIHTLQEQKCKVDNQG